jgi:hypothetical protein
MRGCFVIFQSCKGLGTAALKCLCKDQSDCWRIGQVQCSGIADRFDSTALRSKCRRLQQCTRPPRSVELIMNVILTYMLSALNVRERGVAVGGSGVKLCSSHKLVHCEMVR